MKSNIIVQNAIRFIGLLLLQLLLIDNIQVSGYVNPFIYIGFILLLPINTSITMAMILGLMIGLVNDFFANTGGMHAAAAVWLAFVRQLILRLLSPPAGYEEVTSPNMRDLGFGWFITYVTILVTIHHTTIFFLEIFTFKKIIFTLSKIAMTSIASILVLMLGEFLFNPKVRVGR